MKSRLHVLILFICFYFCSSQNGFSQETYISGKAESQPNELVRLIVYDDMFSHWPVLLDSTFTDSKGNFEFKTNYSETTVALLGLGLKKGEFYLKPGSEYLFDIPLDTNTTRGSVFDELPLQFSYEANDGGLTENIGNFNMEYNEFVLANTNRIYRNRDKKLIRDFNSALAEEYKDVENDYFKDYIKHTIAQLEWISKVKSDDSIVAEYFVNQPVLIHNIQYAEFFTDFFKARFGATKLYTYDELIAAINSNRGYIGIDRLLQRSQLLASDAELRELVAVLLMAKKYYNPEAQKPQVLGILSELNRNSKYPAIHKVSGNFIAKLSKLAYGTKAPSFTLQNQSGENVSLSQFEGKFVLLNFNRSDCKACLYYLQNLEELRTEFKGNLEVITIVTKDGFTEASEYTEARAYEWPVLNLNNEILLLEEYSIRAFPSYLLLNPDQTIALPIAPLPGEGLNLYIKRSMNQFTKLNTENNSE